MTDYRWFERDGHDIVDMAQRKEETSLERMMRELAEGVQRLGETINRLDIKIGRWDVDAETTRTHSDSRGTAETDAKGEGEDAQGTQQPQRKITEKGQNT